MDREERNRRMRENRALLREAGFSSKDIDRLKNASPATIERMLESKQAPDKTGGGRGRKATERPAPVKVDTRKPEQVTIQAPSKEPVLPGKTFRHGGRTETKDERNLRLRQTQELLRAAGLSKKDAARLRNASPETIREILRTGQTPEQKRFYLREKKEFTVTALPWAKSQRQYTNRYNVILELLFYRPGPEYKTEHVTIQANFELSREDAMDAARDIVEQTAEAPKEGSDWRLVDVRIVGAFVNEDIAERARPKTWTKYKD